MPGLDIDSSQTGVTVPADPCRLVVGGDRLRLISAGAAIVALWAIAMSRWIAADAVVPWDSKNQFYAFFRFLAATIHDGSLPFWNPYHYGGHPAVADPQSFVFAPVFVVWALFDPAPSLRAFDLVVHAHLLAGGLALAVIGWRRGWPVSACVLAAMVFMFGGPAAGRLQHTGAILSYAFLPPALLLMQVALERRSLVAAFAFAAVAATLLLGRNQVALLACFVLAAAALVAVASAARPLRYLRERLLVLTAMAVTTAALVAVPMLLTLQFAALSNRADVALAEALKGSLHPANLATLAVADVFGTHGVYWGPNGATAPEVAFTDDSFNYLFVGSVTVMIVLWFGVTGGMCWRRGGRLFAVVLAAALVFMLGRYTPVFAWLYDWVPGVDLFRRPVDAGFLVVAALAVLAGVCLADYVRSGLPRLSLPAVVAVSGAVIAALAAAMHFSWRSDQAGAAIAAIVTTAPLPLVVGLVLAYARSAKARGRAALLATAAAAAELMGWNVAFRLNAESRALYAVLQHPTGAEAHAIDVLEAALRARRAEGARPRVEIVGLGGPWQNLAVVRGWEATNGYNPLRIGVYDRLVAPGESNWRAGEREFPESFAGHDGALARALGLEFLVLGGPLEEWPSLVRRPAAEVLLAGPKVWIYRLADAQPRVSFTRRAAGAGSPVPAGSVRIVSWRPERVELAVASAAGGVLTLHDSYYPAWVAQIDGRPAPVLRAGPLFRAVEIPTGEHRVVFRFAPLTLENFADAFDMVVRRSP